MDQQDLKLEDVLNIIKEKRYQLDFDLDIPEQYKSNKDVIACVMENGNLAFEKLPQAVRENKEILMLIAAKESSQFPKFPEWAKDDKDIVKALSNFGWGVFENISERLRSDREVVILGLSGDSDNNLQYVTSEELKHDKEILKLAVSGHSQALQWVPEKWRSDKELLEIVLSKKVTATCSFEHFPFEYRDNEDVARKVLNDDAGCFQYLSERLRDNSDLAVMALRNRGMYLQYASPRIKDDKEMVKLAIKEGGDLFQILENMSPRLKNDKEIAILAMETDNRNLDDLNPVFLKDVDVINACMKPREYFDGRSYRYFDEVFRNDRAVTLTMSAGSYFPLDAAPEAFRKDKEIVGNAIKSEAGNFVHMASELLNDLPFLKQLYSLNDGILYHMDENLKAKLFSTKIQSADHFGKKVQYTIVLDDGYVKENVRLVQRGEVLLSGTPVLTIDNFPVLTYEEDGPVGSYLSVRYLNNLMLAGQFVFFIKRNSGEETFEKSLLRDSQWYNYGPEPQKTDDFLKHEVYLVPETIKEIDYSDLSNCVLIYNGRHHHLPEGIQLFPTEESYKTALITLKQEQIYGEPRFKRLNEGTLEAISPAIDDFFGAAKVYVDGFGWRLLIPHPEGALKSLEVLKSTTTRDDEKWLQSQNLS